MNPRQTIYSDEGDGSEKQVLVIGAASMDTIGRLKSELHMGTSTPSQIHNSFGGVARNVAENLAHLGQPVKLLSVVGAGPIGAQLLQHLNACGVDTSFVRCTDNHPTSSYLAILSSSGEFQFALDDMRAVSELSSAYIRQHAHLINDAALVFIDGNLSKETLRTVVSIAKKAQVPLCADPTSGSLAARMIKYLPDFHLITPNSAEAEVMADCCVSPSSRKETLTAAKRLVSQGVNIAIVTRAEFGVTYATSETSGHIPAIRTKIVDPTGASDALTATMIFSLLNEIPLDDAVRLSVAAASLTLGHRGAVVPDLSLQRLYDQL
jgi:pseudouridine kinase